MDFIIFKSRFIIWMRPEAPLTVWGHTVTPRRIEKQCFEGIQELGQMMCTDEKMKEKICQEQVQWVNWQTHFWKGPCGGYRILTLMLSIYSPAIRYTSLHTIYTIFYIRTLFTSTAKRKIEIIWPTMIWILIVLS